MTSPSGDNSQARLSVVMPAYNESDNIVAAVEEVCAKVLPAVPNAQLIVVDDGSTDGTGALLDELASRDARIAVLHKQNGGHGPALIAGMNASQAEYLFLIDSDMQVPLDCFPEVWKRALEIDGVFCQRSSRQNPMVRIILSKVIGFAVRLIFGVRAPDINAPCKVFKREIWIAFRQSIPDDTILAPSIMLNIFARAHGYRIAEMAVAHRQRMKGESTLNLRRLTVFCWNGLKQLFAYRNKLV